MDNNESEVLAKGFHTNLHKGDGFLLIVIGVIQSTYGNIWRMSVVPVDTHVHLGH